MKFHVRERLATPEKKRLLNEQLFGQIAAEYDRVTPPLSFGRDRAWKRDLVGFLPPLNRPRCLDVACGTGDLCGLLAAKYPEAEIVGLDLSEAMLNIARARLPDPRVKFQTDDMCGMDFSDGSFDLVTGGYALRNAPNLQLALAEIHRVLKPGGTAAFLDFSKPPSKMIQNLELVALGFWGGIWGLILHGNPEVYGYISASLRQFPDSDAFHRLLQNAGFTDLQARKYFFGIIELVTMRK
jgi:ubiquinone/menaquinone biosynthesis methyltransferase